MAHIWRVKSRDGNVWVSPKPCWASSPPNHPRPAKTQRRDGWGSSFGSHSPNLSCSGVFTNQAASRRKKSTKFLKTEGKKPKTLYFQFNINVKPSRESAVKHKTCSDCQTPRVRWEMTTIPRAVSPSYGLTSGTFKHKKSPARFKRYHSDGRPPATAHGVKPST